MFAYILRRLLYAVPILLGVSLATFALFYLVATPEQMARQNLSARNPSKEQIQEWVKDHGYDKPRSEQAKKHILELFTFNFGKSDSTDEQIIDKIKAGIGPSAAVATVAFAVSVVTALLMALFFAYFRGTYVDTGGTLICVLMMSIVYMVYIIAGQFLMGKMWKLFPLGGFRVGEDAWKFVMLPGLVGAVSGLGASIRLYRTFFLEEVNQDYVRTARAKGVKEQVILMRHVFKNAAIPILTTVVLAIPFLLTGSLLLESFFGIPGIGSMTVDAINSQDFATVRATVFLGTILYIIGSILTDISYAAVDPRVRLE